MSPTIRVSQETYEHLQQQATPFTDTPDSVIRRLLGLDTADAEVVPAEDDAPPTASSSPAREARAAREAPRPRTAATDGSGRSKKRRTSGVRSKRSGRAVKHNARAPRGSLMRDEAYELPILTALADRGGRAGKNEVLDALEPMLADKLTELDRAEINSGEIRWRNRAQFVRLRLVERGEMVKGSPRGIWELAEPGRARLAEAGVAIDAAGAQ